MKGRLKACPTKSSGRWKLPRDTISSMLKAFGMIVMAALPVLAQDGSISAERIREHTRFLSLDLLEGRGVGQRGGDIATEYIATQFALAGAQPAGDNGSYFQKVPLVVIETTLDAQRSGERPVREE